MASNVTPLLEAIFRNDARAVADLLQQGCNVSERDADGWSPLDHAASAGFVDLVRLLVAHGAWEAGANTKFPSPLVLAILGNHKTVEGELRSLDASAA